MITNGLSIPTADASNILTITQPGREIIRIGPDGRIFWHGREVETDDDFRSAMMELATHLIPATRP